MRWRRVPGCRAAAGLAGTLLFCLMPVRAQLTLPREGETLPSFEVATIKPAAADARGERVQWMPDGYRMDNISLSEIIRNAYDAHSSAQLVGGPQPLLDQRFDVLAKMDANDVAQFKAMSPNDRSRRVDLLMQALLRDRFQLKMHVEMRQLPVYALVVAKGGSKLQPTAPTLSEPEPDPGASAPLPPPDPSREMPHRPPHGVSMMRMSSTGAEMSVSAGTMDQLASMLTGQQETGGRLIIDKTGLTGKYDWYLKWTPAGAEMATESSGDDSGASSGAPALFTALQEQLGLRLVSQKGPVQIVVIDHLERPSPN